MPKNSKQFDFFFVLKGQSNKNHFKLVDEIPIKFDLHTRPHRKTLTDLFRDTPFI